MIITCRQIIQLLLCTVLLPAAVLQGATSTTLNYSELKLRQAEIIQKYVTYSDNIWKQEEGGGYWGDGIAAKNANGAVRGSLNTLLGHAWLAYESKKNADAFGPVDRQHLLKRIRENIQYLAAHHASATEPAKPTWGVSWQSSLWLGAGGLGAMLVWDEIDEGDRAAMKRMVAFESNKLAASKPKKAAPGDTGAEENGWNTNVLALAVALHDDPTSVSEWSEALRSYAINTLCTPADANSDKTYGEYAVKDYAFAESLQDDFSILNHHFFHPDYLQVSIQHMGESLAILRLGDKILGTEKAPAFEPFFKHNVQEAWDQTLEPLLMETGEFLYPQGNDWTYHCTTNQGCFSFIAAEFDDPAARLAAHRSIEHVEHRSLISPPGRILGDSNLEWWWEPLVTKRMITGMLAVELAGREWSDSAVATSNVSKTLSKSWEDVDVWMHRNDNYLVSVSARRPFMVTYTPIGLKASDYWTLPVRDGLIHSTFKNGREIRSGDAICYVGETTSGSMCAVVAFSEAAVFLTTETLGVFPVENDTLTTPGRELSGDSFHMVQPPRSGGDTSVTRSIVIDDEMAVASDVPFVYRGTRKWSGLSVAIDHIIPGDGATAWIASAAKAGKPVPSVERTGDTAWTVKGPFTGGKEYKIEFLPQNTESPIQITPGKSGAKD